MPSRVRYERLATERVNPRSRSLDRLSPRAIATLMNREDRRAVAAVGRVAPAIGAGVERIVASLARGGRLVFGSVSEEALAPATTVSALVTRELQVLGTYTSTLADLAAVAALAAGGRLDLSRSVSHRVPLAEADRALDLLAERPPGMARVVVVP